MNHYVVHVSGGNPMARAAEMAREIRAAAAEAKVEANVQISRRNTSRMARRKFADGGFVEGLVLLTITVTAGCVALPIVTAIGRAIISAVEKGGEVSMEGGFGGAKGKLAIRPAQTPSGAKRNRPL